MKTSRSTANQQNKQGNSHKPRPEIRDDMDSRKNKEGNFREKNPQQGKHRKQS
jgi:hypothetical protein